MSTNDIDKLRSRLLPVGDPVSFLSALFMDSPSPFAVFGEDGRCLLTNKAFCELLGAPPPRSYSIRTDDVLGRLGLLREIERAYAGETVKVSPFWYDPAEHRSIPMTSGTRVAIEATLFPLPAVDGALACVAAIYADHTDAALAKERLESEGLELRRLVEDLRRSEQELRQSRQELALIMDTANVAIAYYDDQQRHVFVNRIYAWRLNVPPEFLIGKPLYACLPPAIYDVCRPHVEKALSGLSAEWEMEMTDGHGEVIYVRSSNAPDVGEDGRVRGWVVVITNLTELKRAQREYLRLNAALEERVAERTSQLRAANLELGAANRELESFAYSVSHDLRTPLRSINGYSQMLLAEHAAALDPQGRDSLVRIEASARRMGRLIDALLALSRLGRHTLELSMVDMRSLIAEVTDELSLHRLGSRLELVLGETPPCQADARLLKQVFVNLIGNAVKFTLPEQTIRIEIGARQIEGECVWTVRDNGIGFRMDHAGRLFQVFQRLHDDDSYDGTGVGLALVHRIVQRHGGRIWAEAAAGRGAAFHLTLGGAGAILSEV